MSDREGPYDVVVVGAGPAGLVTGQVAAQNGLSVLILDRKREIGLPVSCAEGISSIALWKFDMSSSDPWVMNRVKALDVFWPMGRKTTIPLPEPGFIINVLDRVSFEKELARRAMEAGARIRMRTPVIGLIKDDGGFTTLQIPDHQIGARVIVGADGISSRIGRWAGMTGTLPLSHVGLGIQRTLQGIEQDPEVIEIYLGRDVAPGGYAWVFPKGEDVANVGLYVRGDVTLDTREVLHRFIEKRAPDAKTIRSTASCIPLAPPPLRSVKDNVVLVGDAGRFTNSFNGAGIANAMITGRHAGNVITKALGETTIDEHALLEYERLCRDDLHEVLMRKYQLKNWFYARDSNMQFVKLLEYPVLAALKVVPSFFERMFPSLCDY